MGINHIGGGDLFDFVRHIQMPVAPGPVRTAQAGIRQPYVGTEHHHHEGQRQRDPSQAQKHR